MTCPRGHKKIICVKYWYDNPYRYDGVKEFYVNQTNEKHQE